MELDTKRKKQTNREALWAIMMSLGYLVWWYFSSYGIAPDFSDTALPQLYFGMPLWFLLSCIIGPILFCFLCGLMVKFIFKDISLDPEERTLDE